MQSDNTNLIDSVTRAIDKGDILGAKSLIESSVALNPSDLTTLANAAGAWFKCGEFVQSLRLFDTCLNANPSINQLWLFRNTVIRHIQGTRSLELGCGIHLKNGFGASEAYGIDIREDLDRKIYRADLAIDNLPFEDNYFDYVIAEHFIVHVPRGVYCPERRNSFIELMSEIWRVLKPHGLFFSITPAYPHPEVFQDPTHVNIITENTFPAYFCFAEPWAKQYGFRGRFNFTSQVWEGPCLKTHLNKIGL
jgi:SAM-dependent methyltransferase